MFPELATPAGMRREKFRAMGTTISVLLPAHQAAMGTQMVRTLFSAWEQTLSRFLPSSELAQLNQRAGQYVVVSELLYHVLMTALAAVRASAGIYDPTLLEQLTQLGYDRSFDELPAVQLRSKRSIHVAGRWSEIQIDAIHHGVMIPAGVRLDFGGIAKGMAVDAALEHLKTHGIHTALINAGGDLAVLGQPALMSEWPVAVPGQEHDWTIHLQSGAMATSGIAHRHWWQGNTPRHHLLDPRTSLPAWNDLWSVTVVTDRCEQAEVAAKVAFILGSNAGADFLRRNAIAGLLVRTDGTWETVEPWPTHLMETRNGEKNL